MKLSQQIDQKISEIDELNNQVVLAKFQNIPLSERVEMIQNLAKAKEELGELQLLELQRMR